MLAKELKNHQTFELNEKQYKREDVLSESDPNLRLNPASLVGFPGPGDHDHIRIISLEAFIEKNIFHPKGSVFYLHVDTEL